MSALGKRALQARPRSLALAASALVVIALLAFKYHLAFTPDRLIAHRLTASLAHHEGLQDAYASLAKHYQVSDIGIGSPWGLDRSYSVPPDSHCFTVLVGEYGFIFITSVEALVVYRPDGRLERVLVRRTTDAF
jgi:hypothetical protein